MRQLISLGAVGIAVVIGTLVNLHPAVVGGAAAQGGPVVNIDPAQLPLPVRLSGSSLAPGSNLLVAVPASDLNPYQERRTFNWISPPCNFGGAACEVAFSVVPGGKRLVVENVSGELVVNAGAAVRTIRLFSNTMSWHLPTVVQSTFVSASTNVVNSQMLAYFEPGQVPRVFINTDAINAGFNNELTLTGHFVQLQ